MNTYELLREQMYADRLENGLPVFVIPKPGYRKTYAFFATDYGSIDIRFEKDGAWHETPAGVAHFLEHKMFDMPDGSNALQMFARTGASPNAFTSHAMTAYHFEAAGDFEENLRILLHFVATPYFTEQSVAKERGIIGQEIRMIEDSPHNRLIENLLGALYARHPMRLSIAGTEASIANITADMLYDCHKAFYHPSRMCLCVAGDVDPERVVSVARAILPGGRGAVITRDTGGEAGDRAYKHEVSASMEVSLPLFALGAVCPPPDGGMEALRFDLLAELAMEALTGRASKLYRTLYNEGLISRSYDQGFYRAPGMFMMMCLGESREPARVRELLLEEVERLTREGLDEVLFERLKRAALGARLRQMDAPESLCRLQAGAYFAGTDYFQFVSLFDTLTAQAAKDLLCMALTPERMALSVVHGGHL